MSGVRVRLIPLLCISVRQDQLVGDVLIPDGAQLAVLERDRNRVPIRVFTDTRSSGAGAILQP